MTAVADHHHDEIPKGLSRWLYTTNHKDIGTLYLWFSFIMFIIGGAMALVIRAELFQPGLQLVNPHFFNQMTTVHALVMIFGAIMPGFVGFANWLVPLMIGAPDMALPRMNNWSFWLLPFAGTLLIGSLFVPGGGPAAGWTIYPPLSIQTGMGMDFTIFAIHLLGMSSILGSINIIATILNMRAPGMTLMKMPLFVWTWLITAFLLLAAMPVLAGAVTMLLTDRHFGTHFFDAAGGGDPLMFQHIFWFFGHPEVYILILPAFGMISAIIPTFARKPLFGYTSMVFATASIAFLSFIVWAHHMYTVGMPLSGELFFMYSTMLIAIPTGVKIFNWLATMWRGSMTFETPMLYAISAVALFTVGGLTGVMMAITPADFQYHDTYFIVAHFHYVIFAGSVLSMFGAVYFWLPKWTGHMYNETLGKWHFWLTVIAFNVTFFPQHFLGFAGMPRRIPDYAQQFTEFNMVSSIGAFVLGFSQILLLINVVRTIKAGQPASDQVWEGAEGLEWTLPSPTPYHTFVTPPKVS
ncbi:MAG TPA: cytochrome c oxidase subunit I [Gammaproteobacteria bacterium]|nr:cytochrome c oxidase subunit I [Gammaproteobacteria bacterium]